MKIKLLIVVLIGLFFAFSPAPRAQPLEQTRSVWDGVFTAEQAKRGADLYAPYCGSCHAPDLSGNDEAPALAGPGFLSNWEGLSVGDLFERVRVSMPPNKPGQLSRQQIVDIISHTLSSNGFPAGQNELARETETLKQIRIVGSKPKSESGN